MGTSFLNSKPVEPTRIWLALLTGFLLVTAGLLASAVYLWRLQCEGFGCTGVGIVWMAWSVAGLGILLAGQFLRTRLPPGSWARQLASIVCWVLLGLAVGLSGYWVLQFIR
jgi:hypothetical protein